MGLSMGVPDFPLNMIIFNRKNHVFFWEPLWLETYPYSRRWWSWSPAGGFKAIVFLLGAIVPLIRSGCFRDDAIPQIDTRANVHHFRANVHHFIGNVHHFSGNVLHFSGNLKGWLIIVLFHFFGGWLYIIKNQTILKGLDPLLYSPVTTIGESLIKSAIFQWGIMGQYITIPWIPSSPVAKRLKLSVMMKLLGN